jgi:hypothetical protein
MTIPRRALAALLVAFPLAAAQRADASTTLGSPDPTATPDAFACAMCPPGQNMAFQQFALRGATVEAPEDGVLVSASVTAKRISGVDQPKIAILRPADDGTGVTVGDSVPVPVSSADGETSDVDDLHVPVLRGDSLGFQFPTGQVDLGVRTVQRPDGAVQSFTPPCDPCGSDGGTGEELLFNGVVEPDVDADGLGDETQDPDGGGLGTDWVDDWYQDYDEGDSLDADISSNAPRRIRRQLRLVRAERDKDGAALTVRVPRAGSVSAAITLPSVRKTGAGPFLTILTGDVRVKHAGRVRLKLRATAPGERVLARRGRLRTKVIVSLLPADGPLKVLMRSARL